VNILVVVGSIAEMNVFSMGDVVPKQSHLIIPYISKPAMSLELTVCIMLTE